MKEIKQVKSSIKKEMVFIFEWGIRIGVILSILKMFSIFKLCGGLYLHVIASWPIGILTGVLIATVVMLLRRTTVLVTRDGVTITRIGKRVQLSIDDFDAPVIRRKEHSFFEVLKKTTLKIYVNVSYRNGTKAYRLYEFSEKELEEVVQYIREQRNDNIPVKEKIAVVDSFNVVFSLSRFEIKQHEKKTILKIGGIWLLVLEVMLIVFLRKFADSSMEYLKTILFIVILCTLLGAVPFQLFWIFWKCKFCPQTIRIGGDALWVDGEYFSYLALSYISMTSPRKESDSIFPVQYWITIKSNGKKYKYWLGSQASYGEYRELCKNLEQALVMRSNKLRYK